MMDLLARHKGTFLMWAPVQFTEPGLAEIGRRNLVQGKIIRTGAEIHVVGVRLPYHLHSQQLFIECARAREIRDAQRHMA